MYMIDLNIQTQMNSETGLLMGSGVTHRTSITQKTDKSTQW